MSTPMAVLAKGPRVTDSPDSEAVRRSQRDPQAFGELYDRYLPWIFRFVVRRVGDQAVAEDITAEVFLKALRGIGRYREAGRPFVAWLLQIATHCIADYYRRHLDCVELPPILADDGTDVADQVVARERSRMAWTAVDRLPAAQRTAMLLKFGQDLSLVEVSEIMGKSQLRSSSSSSGR